MRLAHIVAKAMEDRADLPAIGQRAKELTYVPGADRVSVRLLPRYRTISYRELWGRVRAIAREWHRHPCHPVGPGDRVAVLGSTSADHATLTLACIHLGAVSVPLQTNLPASQLESIIAEVEPLIVGASSEYLDAAVESVLRNPSVGRMLVIDHHHDVDDHRDRLLSARERLARAGRDVAVDVIADVLAIGSTLPDVPLHTEADDDALAMLVYTSGSTGAPKGAMYTQRLVAAMWAGDWSKLYSNRPATTLSYMPLGHIAGQSLLASTLARGGTTYIAASSDLSTLFEDLALARPTELSLIPRVCELLFQHYQVELDRHVARGVDRNSAEFEVKRDLRLNLLGGRVGWATCASAPLSAELTAFIESLLELELRNLYGSTEAAGVAINGKVSRPPVIDYKLVDVPELGYYRTDSPHPRGELLLQTSALIPGYYRQPERTREILDEDGYYKTGDIFAETGPDQLVYIDRRSNVLKLAQGEFVATARLEAIFALSPLLQQIFVYGNSERSHLLAVVVPTVDVLAENDHCEVTVEQLIVDSLRQIAERAGLNSYEVPRGVLVETEPFSQANGLLSDHRKQLRPRLLDRYRDRLERLYTDIAAKQAAELADVRRAGADRPVLETVQRAARAVLTSPPTELAPTAHFRDLGGDSLSAVSFSSLLQEVFGVQVPVDLVISPGCDLRRLAGQIEAKRGAQPTRPTFASVHGHGSTEVHAGELSLAKFIDSETIAGARNLPRPRTTQVVLLTGASGYLGRFLCLEWLEHLSRSGGKLICLVRGKDADSARKRLDDAFASGDPELIRTFRELSTGHLEVLAGDIAEPQLGLDSLIWHRLAEEVDAIVHAGALVNHVLPYSHLFEPNVVGTAELVRLALSGRLKPFTYISSAAVATCRSGHPALDEDADVRHAAPVQPNDGAHASGYATSKWAGEVLLREAHDACGLPVTAFRSSMILAHSRYAGQLNVFDTFTRLVSSIIATGIAPGSFYQVDSDGNRQRAHYDGLPVDFTAAAMVVLAKQNADQYRTFNLVNPHDDGISLDVFVDWLNDAGHQIDRVHDYRDWLIRFETGMRTLPDEQRKHSALPLMQGLRNPEPVIRGSAIPSTRFRAAVRALRSGADGDVPQLSRTLIEKYAADLKRLGFA